MIHMNAQPAAWHPRCCFAAVASPAPQLGVAVLTLVMVGSSQSRSFTRGDGKACAYTPRGYAKKREAAE